MGTAEQLDLAGDLLGGGVHLLVGNRRRDADQWPHLQQPETT